MKGQQQGERVAQQQRRAIETEELVEGRWRCNRKIRREINRLRSRATKAQLDRGRKWSGS